MNYLVITALAYLLGCYFAGVMLMSPSSHMPYINKRQLAKAIAFSWFTVLICFCMDVLKLAPTYAKFHWRRPATWIPWKWFTCVLLSMTIFACASNSIAARYGDDKVMKFDFDSKKMYMYSGNKPITWGKFDEVTSGYDGGEMVYKFYKNGILVAKVDAVLDSVLYLK